jgi:hypothetical protein
MLLDRWIDNAHAIAEAFGSSVWSIYKLRITEWLHD